MADKNIEKKERVICDLTETEIQKLRVLVLGHGNLRKNAKLAKVHPRTLERIILTGRALEENADKIRKNIFGAAKVSSASRKCNTAA